MFFKSFALVSGAVGQIFILGAIGYALVKKDILTRQGMDFITRLVIEVTLPAMIFSKLIHGFWFNLSPSWWVFPLLGLAVTILGLLVGGVFIKFIKPGVQRRQFLSLVAFQNSGYLPLALVAALLSSSEAGQMFIYIFLFLLGFNLLIWSFGVYFLSYHHNKRFELGSFFSPPVLATVITMALVGLGINNFVPEVILKPLRMIGDSTLPLAMLVVGGSLGLIKISRIELKPVILLILAKLLILPLVGLCLIWKFSPGRLFSLLLIMQLSMPSATTLPLIISHYKKEDLLISQGVLFTHLFSLISIPLFLSLVWIK
ncbi:MAG: AEC family transporter [Candidatus Omnitrophica bacterium]|nr:AEC family transporter [Candidatus Omnitrophota bacterium]MBU1871478.1 AEC family transporter [Candidatus Omnitrophota bacterium]